MAKTKNRIRRETTETNTGANNTNGTTVRSAPEGYQKRTTDIVGTWDYKLGLAIHFIPKEASCSDSQLDKKRSSILILGTAIGTNQVTTKEGEVIEAEQGETIGVWYKAGMAAIKNLAGVPVYMFQEGEQDTGKPNAMKLFDISSPREGNPILITNDYREKSLQNTLPFEIVARNRKSPKFSDHDIDNHQREEEGDEPPF